MENNKPILFFDGHCNLCNGMIDFLVRQDSKIRVLVAPLRGQTAEQKLPQESREKMSSIVLLKPDGDLYSKSAAAFRVAWAVGGLLRVFTIFWILPRPITDYLYDQVAAARYKIFGKRETCRIPSEEEKQHFLP